MEWNWTSNWLPNQFWFKWCKFNYCYNFTKADLYGSDVSCFPEKLVKLTEEAYQEYAQGRRNLFSISNSIEDEDVEAETVISISDFQSGGDIESMYLALVDKYNQIVGYGTE